MCLCEMRYTLLLLLVQFHELFDILLIVFEGSAIEDRKKTVFNVALEILTEATSDSLGAGRVLLDELEGTRVHDALHLQKVHLQCWRYLTTLQI